ncbi:Tat pathway signal protein [Embleya sp. MST-111070]|uniref:Tat pathway signal protein n=1 Tax=Embleya sp. MST-111070 TaxID=3398231 RepID=UPI003F73B749
MRPNLLRDLVRERGWNSFDTFDVKFCVARDALAGREREPRLHRVSVSRRSFERWMAGETVPHTHARRVLEYMFGRTAAELFGPPGESDPTAFPSRPARHRPTDTVAAIRDLGEQDLDMRRRSALSTAAYSLAAIAVPVARDTDRSRSSGSGQETRTRTVGRRDLDAVREMVAMFSRIDQRRGGGHARGSVVQYLVADVSPCLEGRFADDEVRQAMFSSAAELAYLSGWMAFDNAEHAVAQNYFDIAVKLAVEADDDPMTGHVLRAMAHQAVDLGHRRHALDLAAASVDGPRYARAAPRERALLGVVHARALAATDQPKAAAAALLRAENDLDAAVPDGEPDRVFFFAEAGLAHETACTLRDIGDLTGAVHQFRRSVRTRKATAFTRTHAVTLGYLGAVQARRDSVEEACATWSQALDAMDGLHSARARRTAVDMRGALTPHRGRGMRFADEVDARAAAYLTQTI